jgi:hypothetical protein
VLSGRGLCVGLITRPEECYVSEYDREALRVRRSWPNRGILVEGGIYIMASLISEQYLRAFLVNSEKRLLALLCPSVHPGVSARLPLDGFS